jgi:integrase
MHFRQATDRRTKGAVKTTKSGKARRIPIEPNLRPLLDALKKGAAGTHVIPVPGSKRADTLRENLELAGVTWMALRGDEPLVIQQRAGHANFTTTQRYLREAETRQRRRSPVSSASRGASITPRITPHSAKYA